MNSVFDNSNSDQKYMFKRRNRYDATVLSPVVDPRSPKLDPILAKLETLTQDVNEMMRDNYLKKVSTFQDLHNPKLPPSYVHRVNCEIKHMSAVGDTYIITNDEKENISLYAYDTP